MLVTLWVLLLLVVSGTWSALYQQAWINKLWSSQGTVWRIETEDGVLIKPMGNDVVQFIAVGRMGQANQWDRLYDHAFQHETMRSVAGLPDDYEVKLHYNYPPFFAWLCRPLALVDYRTAYEMWIGIHLALFALGLVAIYRILAGQRSAFFILVLLAVTSAPFYITMHIGQTAFLGFAAWAWATHWLNQRKEFSAGTAVSILFYKPIFGFFLGPVLLLKGRWRTVAGVALGGAVLLLLSLAVSMRATLDYPAALAHLRDEIRTTDDFTAKQMSWLSCYTVLVGRQPFELSALDWMLVGLPIAAIIGLVVIAWAGPWRPGSDSFAAALAVTILATLFACPYLFPYDCMVLAVAAAWSTRTLPRRPTSETLIVLACLTITLIWLAGFKLLLDTLPIRLQATPIALAVWCLLETRIAWLAGRNPDGNLLAQH